MEGFPEALKYLQKDTDWAENVPLLSDIISCEEKYRLAVENFLDPWINHYIVRHEADAYTAIQLLKQADKGKAHFLILEKLGADFQPPEALEASGYNPEASLFFGGMNASQLKHRVLTHRPVPALEVVSYEPEHAALIYYLLKEVYIVENPQDVPPEDHNSYVTVSGDVIRRQYSLTGGSVGSFEGKRIGRRRSLDQLSEEIQGLEEKIYQQKETLTFKSANLQSLKQNKSLKEAYRLATQKVNQINEQYVILRSKRNSSAKSLTTI
ncbi:MAG: hypothetical protein HC880_15285 [Bacteroidia bacterium]|nr:hypothetical protein [Bacteroidia bacterium]